jgi:hypothetical protein
LDGKIYFRQGYKPGLLDRLIHWRAVSFMMAVRDTQGDGFGFKNPDQLKMA